MWGIRAEFEGTIGRDAEGKFVGDGKFFVEFSVAVDLRPKQNGERPPAWWIACPQVACI